MTATKMQTDAGDKINDAIGISRHIKIDNEKAIDRVCRNILLSSYNHGDSAIQVAAARVYKQWYGIDLVPGCSSSRPCGLFGPPGCDMTAVFREAAKKCASAMGLEYVEDADLLTTNATKKHFGFVMQDAFVSSGDQLLDMRKMDLLNQEQHQERVRQLMKCGAGVLVMDNLFYASPLVQSRMMGLVEKGRFDEQDSASVTLGITGNRSALDDLDMHRVAVPWEVRFDHFLVDGEQASAKDECVPLYSGVPNKDGKDGDRRLAVTEEKSGPSPADCMDGLADRVRASRDNLGTGARTHEQIPNKQPPEMGMTAARNKPF